MKTKLLGTTWKGSASCDPRFSAAMLKWIITDIRNRGTTAKLSIGIENGVLETYNTDFELQFKHQIKHIIGMCLIVAQKSDIKSIGHINNLMHIIGNKTGFLYLLKIPIDPLLHIYLFECDFLAESANLLESIQNHIQMSFESVGIKIPQAIIPKSSDANDDQCLKQILGSRNGMQATPASNLKLTLSIKQRGNQPDGLRPRISASKSFTSGFNTSYKEINTLTNSPTSANLNLHATSLVSADTSQQNHLQYFEVMFVQKIALQEKTITKSAIDEVITAFQCQSMPETLLTSLDSLQIPLQDDEKDENFERNRMMVLMIGQEFRIISPDHKKLLLCKNFADILNCEKGATFPDHFALIYRSHKNYDSFIGYLFKCQSKSIVDDIVSGITLMMIRKKKENYQVIACESCPMLWYHNLCVDLEGLNDKKSNGVLRNYIDRMPADEQNIILTKFNGAEDVMKTSIAEQNQFLMMLLRAHCEYKNERHVHDVEGNKHFFTEPLSSRTFFMKAKRSLTSSFDHLLKRKGNHNRDDIKVIITNDIDLKSDEKLDLDRSPQPQKRNSPSPRKTPDNYMPFTKSWRQEIFYRVVTPSKNFNKSLQESYFSPMANKKPPCHRTKEDLRKLWRTAIRQIILLSRMEKENETLQAKQNEHEIKRIKLEYEDISACGTNACEIWDEIIKEVNRNRMSLLQAIKLGVPRQKRGEIWLYLKEINKLPAEFSDEQEKIFSNYKMPYQDLLKSFTEHQHAIFIDLGRTFPNHKFYKQSLGVGQLSLFNLLKAYSILDPELGYCQGLGFICGILLLHLDEVEAFNMLKYLMFERQMRLKYLPEMKHFQLQLYQLSRLVKDYLPDLHDWLEKKDISTTLYAAPWILTVFSSQFSLGFVTRVFDLLFVESSEIIFKVSLALLIIHKNQLLARDNFEDIVGYIKNCVTQVDATVMERVLKIVFTTNISILLNEYQIEYNVLQEEINLQTQQLDILEKTKEENQNLTRQLEIAQSCIKQLEDTTRFRKTEIDTLHSQIINYESTIDTLKSFINLLIELNKNAVAPETPMSIEIRNLIHQFNSKIGMGGGVAEAIKVGDDESEGSNTLIRLIDKLLDNYSGDAANEETIRCLEKIRKCLVVCRNEEGGGNGGGGSVCNANLMLKFNNMNGHDSGISTPISPGHVAHHMQQL